MKSLRFLPQVLLICTVTLGSVNVAHAAKWRTHLGLDSRLIYTDNVYLSADDTRGGLSARITPRIGLTGDGRRLKLDFFYAPSLLYRFYSGGDNRWTNNLSARLWSELYKDIFFVEAAADASRNFIDIGGPRGDDVNETGNTTQTLRTSISPYMQTRIGPYADVNVRYTYDRVWYDEVSGNNSYSNRASFLLDSGRKFNVIDWTVSGDYQKIKYSAGDESTLAKFLARVGYRLNRIWRANAFLGYDDNNFLTLADALNKPESDGTAYGLGFTWSPSTRTNLDVAYAHRFFGDNLYFDYSHRSRRSVITASLSHEPYNARNELLNDQTFQRLDEFGNPIEDPSGENVSINPDTATLDTNDYIRRRLELNYILNRKRGSSGLNAFYTKREYAGDREDIRNYGIRASLSHSLKANLASNISLLWRRVGQETDIDDDTEWDLRLGLSRRLAARTSLSLDYLYRNRSSDISLNEYTENRISLNLRTNW